MLKVGMVGMGGISHSHRKAWSQIPEAKIVSVCDIREENVREAAEETGGKAYSDLDEMLSAESLDILDICLPTYLHADAAVKALERGIHVITEKPISLRKADVARVYQAAEAHHCRFMVAQVLRFWREYIALKDAYDSGRWGKLLSGNMTRIGHTPKWSWDNWMRDPERSGLVPFDLHIHDLDFMVYAFGEPKNMTVHRAKRPNQDAFSVVYEYPGFYITTEAAWYDTDYHFQAAYRFQFEHAVMEYKDGVCKIYPAEGGCVTLEADKDANVNGINLPATNGYFNEIRYFTDCVLAGKDCERVRPRELECVLEIIDRINRESERK